MTATASPPVADGRAARTLRTRAAIVNAHVDLLGEGNLRPTGEHIAARAGISVRSVWLHFPELEALFAATAAEVLARQDRAFRPVDPGLPLESRIDAFCRQRAAVLERIAPFARASVLREPFSPALRDYRHRHVERVLDEVEVLFGSELDRFEALSPALRSVCATSIAAAVTWGAWATLREDLGLSRTHSRTVMMRIVRALLLNPDQSATEARSRDPEHPNHHDTITTEEMS